MAECDAEDDTAFQAVNPAKSFTAQGPSSDGLVGPTPHLRTRRADGLVSSERHRGENPFGGLGSGRIGRSACRCEEPDGRRDVNASPAIEQSIARCRRSCSDDPAARRSRREVSQPLQSALTITTLDGETPTAEERERPLSSGASGSASRTESNSSRRVKEATRFAWRCEQSDSGSGAIDAERQRWVTAEGMPGAIGKTPHR